MAFVSTFSGTGTSRCVGTGSTRFTIPLWLLCMGDSKTEAAGNIWPAAIAARLKASWVNTGVGGRTVQTTVDNLTTALPASRLDDPFLLINLGVNDALALPSQSAWVANYLTIIDAAIARWPGVHIYIMRVWGEPRAVNCAVINGWIDGLITARPANVFYGPDETIWLQGNDDGATMTYDGIHYRDAGAPGIGEGTCVIQWYALLASIFGVG